jgi:hypothetical protein
MYYYYITCVDSCGIVIDIGRNESRALAICHGQVIMSSFCGM